MTIQNIQKENYMFADEAGNQQQIPDTFLSYDIDWSGKYDIRLTPPMTFPPKHATQLQKWNDKDTTSFVKYAMTLPEFENKLSVVKAI